MQNKPYFVEPDAEGCRRCGSGKSWSVIGPDDVALATTFDDKDDAEHHAAILTEAFRAGYRKSALEPVLPPVEDETPRETLTRLVAEDGFDVVLAGLLEIVNRDDPGFHYRQRIVTGGVEAIAKARDAQIAQGYDAAHDDAIEQNGALAKAAAWLLIWGGRYNVSDAPEWATALGTKLRDKADRLSVLSRAGALIAAEIDRLKRAELKAPPIEAQVADLASAHPSGVPDEQDVFAGQTADVVRQIAGVKDEVQF